MRLIRHTSRLCRPAPRAIGLPTGSRRESVSVSVGESYRSTVPRPIGPGSYARAFSPLRSSFASPPGRPSYGRPLLPGFLPSSRRNRRSPHSRAIPTSRFVPPSGFLNLSAAYSTVGSTGLFHPAATSRVSPFRGFSRSAAVPTRRRALPPCRCDAQTHRRPGCHPRASRLRGVVPQTGAFLGVGG